MDGQGEPLYLPVAVPSDRNWFDPPLIARNLYTRSTRLTVAGDSVQPLAPANPYRWALWFWLLAEDEVVIAPFPNILFNNGIALDVQQPLYYSLPDYGPLVTGEWFAFASGPEVVDIMLVEVIRQSHWRATGV